MSIYLNNAATTYPKPPAVVEAVCRSLTSPPIEPGRSGHGPDLVQRCREELAELLHVSDPRRIAILPSATYALNAVILGLLDQDAWFHAVTTALEHNSVLRPLEYLRTTRGLRIAHVEPRPDGHIARADLVAELDDATRLIAVAHASNVTGSIQPIAEIAELATVAEVPLLIDASQSVGVVDIDYEKLPGRVFVAMAGHKGLYGPSGLGILIVPDARLPQKVFGGTGVRSEPLAHPGELPLRHEAGTPNLPDIAGLLAGIRFVKEHGIEALGAHRHRLVSMLRAELQKTPGCRLAPLANGDGRAGIVSFNMDGWQPAELGQILGESFDITVRTGLHCAPLAHAALGIGLQGNVRVSVGAMNTEEEIATLVAALQTITASCVA